MEIKGCDNMIDSHMHINSYFNNISDLDKINNNKQIENVINVGLDIITSREIVSISLNNDKMYTAIGIHPLYTKDHNPEDLFNLVNDKVVAIGEIGFDNTDNDYNNQKYYFVKQILIANELKLPVIIHSKNSNEEIINIFKNIIKPKYGCVFHCFQPDIEIMKYLVENRYYISFAGPITYKSAKKSIDIIKQVPIDMFLVETDSPYMTPEPYRDEINNSNNLKYIISKVAEIKNMSTVEIENITTLNTKRLFKKMV